VTAPEALLVLLSLAGGQECPPSLSRRGHPRVAATFGADFRRLTDLTAHLKHGRLNAALALCQLDFIKG
jgi:hypothetical protein